MKATAVLLGLLLLLGIAPGSSRVPGQTVLFAEGRTPISGAPLDELSVTAVVEHATNELPGDVFIKVDGLEVKSSNCRGVAIGDQTYFYCLSPHFCSCPVCRGVFNPTTAEFVRVNEPSGFSIVVYSLDGSTPSAVEVNVLIADRVVW